LIKGYSKSEYFTFGQVQTVIKTLAIHETHQLYIFGLFLSESEFHANLSGEVNYAFVRDFIKHEIIGTDEDGADNHYYEWLELEVKHVDNDPNTRTTV